VADGDTGTGAVGLCRTSGSVGTADGDVVRVGALQQHPAIDICAGLSLLMQFFVVGKTKSLYCTVQAC